MEDSKKTVVCIISLFIGIGLLVTIVIIMMTGKTKFEGISNVAFGPGSGNKMVFPGGYRKGPWRRPVRSLISMPYGPFVVPRPLDIIDEGYCVAYPELKIGAISVPAGKVTSLYGSEWTIAMFIKINKPPNAPVALDKPFVFLTLGLAHPSPKMTYFPEDQGIELSFTNQFNVTDATLVSTYPIKMTNEYNHLAWVQTPNFLQFYINGNLVADKAIVSPAKINKYGDFFIQSQGLIQYRNIKICDRAWNTQTVLAEQL